MFKFLSCYVVLVSSKSFFVQFCFGLCLLCVRSFLQLSHNPWLLLIFSVWLSEKLFGSVCMYMCVSMCDLSSVSITVRWSHWLGFFMMKSPRLVSLGLLFLSGWSDSTEIHPPVSSLEDEGQWSGISGGKKTQVSASTMWTFSGRYFCLQYPGVPLSKIFCFPLTREQASSLLPENLRI